MLLAATVLHSDFVPHYSLAIGCLVWQDKKFRAWAAGGRRPRPALPIAGSG